jgi:uncharacterized protein YcfL
MKRIIYFFTLTILALSLVACSSSKKKKLVERDNTKTIKRDYEVRDASSDTRPAWIYQTMEWAEQNDRDLANFRYFSFETEPKVNREIACNLARANVKADVAGEITTFISQTLGASQQGSADIDENNPHIQALRNYAETTLTQKVQAIITGAAVMNTYWEKRQYLEKLGAKKDFIGYTCSVLIRMNKSQLAKAIEAAQRDLEKRAEDPEAKASVKKAIEEAKEEFSKIKG